MSGAYLLRKPVWIFLIRWLDTLGRILVRPRRRPIPRNPRRILISKIDHLGDVLMSLAVLAPLRAAFPNAEIDYLVNSESAPLLEKHPTIKRVLHADHFLLSRGRDALVRHFSTVVRSDYRAYDLAIDLRANFPNAIPLLRLKGARCIVGWTTGGFGFLLDHAADWKPGRHEIEHHADLLRSIGVDGTFRIDAGHLCAEPARESVLVSAGAGRRAKLWDTGAWRDVTRALVSEGVPVKLIGGESDRDGAEAIRSGGAENVAGRTTLRELASMVRGARLVVGVDSFPCHLAAAFGTPLVVIYTGEDEPARWRPVGPGEIRVVLREEATADRVIRECGSLLKAAAR